MARRVVVTGIGLICGVGNTTEEIWKNLLAGKSGVARITHFDAAQFACQIAAEVKNFDPLLFVEKKELKKMGRFIYLALAAADEAMKASGRQSVSIAMLDDERSGIVLSCIHHRDQARVYAKHMQAGQPELELSPEEAEAVRLALSSPARTEDGAEHTV